MSENQITEQRSIEVINAKDVTEQLIAYIAVKTFDHVKDEINKIDRCIRDNIKQILKDNKIQCDKYTLEIRPAPYDIQSIIKIRDDIADILAKRLKEEYKTLKDLDTKLPAGRYWIRADDFLTYLLNLLTINTKDEKIVIYDVELYSLSL